MPRPVHPLARAVALLAVLAPVPALAQGPAVSGTLLVWDAGDRQAQDVAQAVVWLEPATRDSVVPDTAVVLTEGKEFRPRISVVTVGSVIAFPNNDPFNHNVFSLSPEAPFDLGLYGRNRSKSASFARPGLIRVYCNVHASMSAFVVVVPSSWHTRPGADGRFTLERVRPGRYMLKAWHERAETVAERPLLVSATGVTDLKVELDARQFKPVEHLNKFGKPYRTTGRRY